MKFRNIEKQEKSDEPTPKEVSRALSRILTVFMVYGLALFIAKIIGLMSSSSSTSVQIGEVIIVLLVSVPGMMIYFESMKVFKKYNEQ